MDYIKNIPLNCFCHFWISFYRRYIYFRWSFFCIKERRRRCNLLDELLPRSAKDPEKSQQLLLLHLCRKKETISRQRTKQGAGSVGKETGEKKIIRAIWIRRGILLNAIYLRIHWLTLPKLKTLLNLSSLLFSSQIILSNTAELYKQVTIKSSLVCND